MSDPAVAALGDKQLDEVDLDTNDSGPADGQNGGLEKDVSPDADGTETKAMEDSSVLESTARHSNVEMEPSALFEPQHLDAHPADELHRPESPTTSLITSLRSQVKLLSEQSHQLNTKLVASISRHADLEDQHYNLQHQRDELKAKNAELTKVKETWEESMKTGLYVEQSQIKDEMQRLAAGIVEEERRRGSAEQRRQDVENEVDELAASLFDQANTMVAQERMGRLEAESRLKSTEENLAAAEAAVRDMQLHLQSLPNTAIPAASPTTSTVTRRYISSHVPYLEFLSFVQHIRSLRPLRDASKLTFPPPLATNLLAQAFLARAVSEDHDPTLRLDAAPDLSWLSRRSVSSAIVGGELVIEPISASSLLATTTSPPGDIGCSLCGKAVFPQPVPQSPAVSHFGPPPVHPTQRNAPASRFSLKPFFNTSNSGTSITTTSPGPNSAPVSSSSPLPSPISSPNPASGSRSTSSSLPSVYIFRIAKSSATASTDKSQESQSKPYPLCKSGWCLERLRATCELWHFVRTGIIQIIWTGDDGYLLQTEIAQPVEGEKGEVVDLTEEKPPLPPRKRSGWGLSFNSKSSTTGGSSSGATASGSGGGGGSSWTKGWGGTSRNGTSSPPLVSPRGDGPRSSIGAGSIGAEKGSDEVIDTEAVAAPGVTSTLDEPVEIHEPESLDAETKGKDKEEDTVPIIQETQSSPTTTTTNIPHSESPASSPPPTGHNDGLLQPEARGSTELKRAESAVSLISTNRSEHEQFTTPQSEHADQLDAEGEKLQDNTQSNPTTTAETETGTEAESGTENAETKDVPASEGGTPIIGPPPVPKRAAGRSRLNESKDLSAESRGGSPPIDQSTLNPVADDDATAARYDPREASEVSEVVNNEDEASRTPLTPTSTPRPVPPLPPRHPQTPKSGGNRESRVEEKTYLRSVGHGEEEEWETKTWKMVVKLKEQMWKTRLGVVDTDPDAE